MVSIPPSSGWTPKLLRVILYWCYARQWFNTTTSSKSRSGLKGITLEKWESTMNLCVRAHGYDVELIMKASRKDNYPLGKFLLHLQLVPLQSWFWPWYSPLIPFINNVEHLSSTSQRSSSTSIVFHLRELPPRISMILWHCTTSCEFLLVRYLSSVLPIHRF